jgi:hypothetical protein
MKSATFGWRFFVEPTNSVRSISGIFPAEAIERYRVCSSILGMAALR